jgi:hypothetical protein
MYTMINELFEIFPEYVAFQILTYSPHKTADMIRKYWHMKNVCGMFKIINEEMRNPEYTISYTTTGIPYTITGIPYTNFYGWYMYTESPQWQDNVMVETGRENNGIIWYL